MDVGPAVAVVAGVDTNSFTEAFFDEWLEYCARPWQVQAGEGEVGRLEGAG